MDKNSPNETNFYVNWVGQFKSSDDFKAKDGFFSKIKNFILGDEKFKLVKPTAIIAKDTSEFLILDQGLMAPVIINKESGKFKFIHSGDIHLFPSLVGLCRWKNNNILFTDSGLNKIFIYNFENNECTILNESTEIFQPTGIAYSRVNDEIWVSETSKHRILILDSTGKIIRVVGKRGASTGEFNFPTFITIPENAEFRIHNSEVAGNGLSIDDGRVFIVDALNYRIQIFNTKGEYLSMFGEQGDATGYFSSQKGIALDSYGHIFIVDALFHAVQAFDNNGNFLYNFGRQGRNNSEFWMPSGIYIDKSDYVYVADCYNSRIQIFKLIKE